MFLKESGNSEMSNILNVWNVWTVWNVWHQIYDSEVRHLRHLRHLSHLRYLGHSRLLGSQMPQTLQIFQVFSATFRHLSCFRKFVKLLMTSRLHFLFFSPQLAMALQMCAKQLKGLLSYSVWWHAVLRDNWRCPSDCDSTTNQRSDGHARTSQGGCQQEFETVQGGRQQSWDPGTRLHLT